MISVNLIPNPTAVCVDLSEISNGFIIYDNEQIPRPLGTVALYECNLGFFLRGEQNRTCVEASGVGVFDGVESVCECECNYVVSYYT